MAIYKGNTKLDANGLQVSSVPVGTIVQYDGDTVPTGYEEVNGLENYSTTEQRVGTWIDEKPLYQKVITGTCPDYSSSTITTDIDIASNVDFAFIENQFVVSSTGNCFPLPREKFYINDVGEEAIDNSTIGSIYGSTKKYRLRQNSTNVNGYTYYAVIRYTKTTD